MSCQSPVPCSPFSLQRAKHPTCVLASLALKGWARWDMTSDSRPSNDMVKLSTECCACPFAGPGRV